MTFKTQIASDVSSVFLDTDDFAVACTTSAGATINGIMTYWQDLSGYEGGGQAATANVEVSATDLPNPERYQTLTINSVEWRIDNIISGDGYMWHLSLSSDQRLA